MTASVAGLRGRARRTLGRNDWPTCAHPRVGVDLPVPPPIAHEDRHLQRQRHQRPPAAPARMARRVAARRRLPAGAQDLRRDLSGRGASRDAGYGAIWHGQKAFNGVAILARGDDPSSAGAACPAIPDDTHSRYIEAAVHGVIVASIYLPNGNPQPGPKFDYKLAWFERLTEHAAALLDSERAGGAGRRLQRRRHRRGRRHLLAALVAGRRAAAAGDPRRLPRCWRRAGPTRSARCIPASRSTPSGTTSATASRATPGLRIDHLLLNAPAAARLRRRRRRPGGARAREAERPRADLDRPALAGARCAPLRYEGRKSIG